MIDNTLMPKGDDNQEVQIISENAIVSLKISTSFYKRIQAILARDLAGISADDIKEMHAEIMSKDIKNDRTFHYETLLILCKEFDTNAKDQGFVETTTLGELKAKMSELSKD